MQRIGQVEMHLHVTEPRARRRLPVPEGHPQFGDRLRSAREAAFVGRAGELDRFRALLAQDPPGVSVLFVHGAGGIGKSSLLSRMADLARDQGHHVVRVDGRTLDPSPHGFRTAAAGVLAGGAVLIVDTFEHCQGLEGWLWESYLPQLPSGTVVVVAGRQPPDLRWRTDPAWRRSMQVVRLTGFSREEAGALMRSRGVPAHLHEAVFAFAGGHALALALAAEVVARDPDGLDRWRPLDAVLRTLLDQLVGDVPSPAHRRALEICAHVFTTTEPLLEVVFGDRAAEMYAWLRDQPFVEAGPLGLFPHDLVRDLLNADLRWRDPAGWEAMHRQIRGRLVADALAARGAATLPAMTALNYLHRNGEVMGRFMTWRGLGMIYEDTYAPADREAVLALAHESTDDATAKLVAYWLDRRPEAFTVYRLSATEAPVAFLAVLRQSRRDPEDVAVDPVVAAAWEHAERTRPLTGNDHLLVVRFVVAAGGPPVPAPATDLMILRGLAAIVADESLAWSFVHLDNPRFWEPMLRYIEHPPVSVPRDADRDPDRDADAGTGPRGPVLFVHDWREMPLGPWTDLLGDRILYGAKAERPAEPGPVTLTPEEFGDAVREVLRSWNHRPSLAASPLVGARLAGHGSLDRRVDAVRAAVQDVVRGMRGTTRLDRQHRALVATYFRRTATTQVAAAARLHLSFSTYRRHLTGGTAHLVEELWEREVGGYVASPPAGTPVDDLVDGAVEGSVDGAVDGAVRGPEGRPGR